MDDLVWYVAYGSNLAEDRLMTYLTGGVVAGSPNPTPQFGARDATPPLTNRRTDVPHPLVFAGASKRWNGGGVAFVDPNVGGRTGGRAWLITVEQFADIYAQENGQPPSAATTSLVRQGRSLASGWYHMVLPLGELDGHPARTFTHPSPASLGLRAPDPSYLAVIERGRRELGFIRTDSDR